MKKKFLGLVLAILLPVVALTGAASAQTFRTGESSGIAKGETVDGSAFMTGSSVDVAGKVNGDLYCAAQTVTISGDISGDVLCAAQTINLTGNVSGDVRLAGQSVTVSGTVAKSASIVGQTVTLEQQGSVGQDAVLVGQTVTLSGPVARDAVVTASAATLEAAVTRNVTANVQNLTLAKGAALGGSLAYSSPHRLTMQQGAKVSGKISYTQTEQQAPKRASAFGWIAPFLGALMLVVTALLFTLLFPRALHRITLRSVTSQAQTWLAVLVGFIAGIVMPIAVVLLMATVLGIPFAVILLLGWLFTLSLSGVVTAYYLGRLIWRRQPNVILTTLVGSVIIAVLLVIPILNMLVGLLCLWFGAGTVLMELKRRWVSPRYNLGVQEPAHGLV